MNKKLDLEKEVINSLKSGIQKAVETCLVGYSSPLVKFASAVVEEKEEELKSIMRDALSEVTASKEFKASIKEAFLHKVARTFVDKLDGSVKQAVDSLRQDPTVKARIVLAVQAIIDGKK